MKLNLPKHINPRSKTAVYIDAANMFYSQKTIGFKIDYKKLYKFFNKAFNLISVSYYTGYDPLNKNQIRFLNKMEKFGYQIVSKPIKRINTEIKIIDKANVDVELAIDATMKSPTYINVVIASGDSDFGYLFKILKNKDKKIIVLSSRGHISRELRFLSDKYIPLESIRAKIELKKSPPIARGEVNVN